MLQGAGYPANPYKLEEVATYLKMPSRTLRRWFNGEAGAPLTQTVTLSKKDLASMFEDLAYKMLEFAGDPDVIDDMSGKDAVMSAAIAVDKMRLLQGLPTEIIVIMPQLMDALHQAGLDPVETFQKLIARAHEHANR